MPIIPILLPIWGLVGDKLFQKGRDLTGSGVVKILH